MVFRRFRVVCSVRIILLTATLFLALHVVSFEKIWALAFILVALSLYQVYSLITYVDRTNRDLTRFFQSIKYEDYSQSFRDEGLGRSFSALRSVLADVMNTLRKTRAEKEEHAHYLQTVVQHVGIGVLVFQPDGTVELINNAAKHLLHVPWLKQISALNSLSKELVETLFRLPPKEKGFVKIEREKETLLLSLYATEFRLRGRDFKLVSIQNIHRELEEKEMEAWQKLIRVITHEIMNSVTPISTLASTINSLITEPAPLLRAKSGADAEVNSEGKTPSDGRRTSSDALPPLLGRGMKSRPATTGAAPPWNPLRAAPRAKARGMSPLVKRDIRQAAQTIEKRSQGLLLFVDAFRSLTLVPKPKLQFFRLKELMDNIGRLMTPNMAGKNIRFSIEVDPESLELNADPELIEQVLINLLLNALQAIEGRTGAEIQMKASLNDRGKIIIQVIDNGPGIPSENLEKIFVPFFSTKQGGSGIGLSLSRQIMRLHRGTIHVHSESGGQTVFTLTF